jgi:hypothetical protein
MAYGTGMVYGFSSEALAPLVGGLAGATQVGVTTVLDSTGATGAAVLPQVWPTNGELINTVAGAGAITAVSLSAAGHGRYLQQHPKTRIAVLTYGILTLAAGWLIPGLVRVLLGTGVFGARGRRGAGRYAYLPSEQLRADRGQGRRGLADYGSGVTSQANQQVLRRLFTSQ